MLRSVDDEDDTICVISAAVPDIDRNSHQLCSRR